MKAQLDLEESRRVTLAACTVVTCSELAFGIIDLRVLGTTAAAFDFAHAALAMLAIVWLWRRGSTVRAYEVAFTILALSYLPAIFVAEVRGAELGLMRDPLVPLQFLMVGIAVFAPLRVMIGIVLLVVVCTSTIAFWLWLRSAYPVYAADGEPWMTLVYAGIAGTFLHLRVRRTAMMHELASARAEADALARVARLFVAVRDKTNTPLQTLELSIGSLAQRYPEASLVIDRMSHAVARLNELSLVYAATEAWQPAAGAPVVDLAREVEEATRALEEAFEKGARMPAPKGTAAGH
jgi:hypothetical protein